MAIADDHFHDLNLWRIQIPELEQITFYDLYEDYLAPGNYDAPDGPEFLELFQKWVQAGRPNMKQFIRTNVQTKPRLLDQREFE